MDTFLYILALLVYLFMPPTFLSWLLVHPFIGLWRWLGVGRSYAILGSLMLLMAAILFLFREPVLALHAPVSFWHAYSGVLLLLVSLVLRFRLERELPRLGLLGLPELQGRGDGEVLATGGIYSRVRHPRYLEGFLLLFGFALITNYLAIYVLWALYLPCIVLVILLEERELIDRFGERYRRYRSEVPMLFPRLWKLPQQ